jgi:hypothetical protein
MFQGVDFAEALKGNIASPSDVEPLNLERLNGSASTLNLERLL